MEQMDLFPNGEVTEDRKRLNPMIRAYGTGPTGAKCKNCKQFSCVQYANRYYKCELRGTTGASTDHNYHFDACGKYEPEESA